MLTIIIDKLLKTQVVECAAVANWLFSAEMSHDFTRFYFFFTVPIKDLIGIL